MSIEIRNAKIADLEDVIKIHQEFVSSARTVEEMTFIDTRTKQEIKEILQDDKSYIIYIDKVIIGYSLFSKYKDGVIGKGIVINNKAKGLGLQRMIYKMVMRKHNTYIISSKFNLKSIKNIIGCGLMPIEQINEVDFLYGAI